MLQNIHMWFDLEAIAALGAATSFLAYHRDLNSHQYYGSIFLGIIMVYGTSNGPQHDIDNYLGSCRKQFQAEVQVES